MMSRAVAAASLAAVRAFPANTQTSDPLNALFDQFMNEKLG